VNRANLGFIVFAVSVLLAACNSEPIRGALTKQEFGTTTTDQAFDVAAPTGGVGAMVVGITYGSLDGSNKGNSDAFLRKYDGGAIWAQQFGTQGFDSAGAVAVTGTGVSYVAGSTNGTLGFKVGGFDDFLRKYDPNGMLQWTRQFGTPGDDSARDVSLDNGGNIYVLSKDSTSSFTVRKFNPNGTLLLTITNSTTGVYDPPAVAMDSTGNIYVLSRFYLGANSFARIFKYSSTGTLIIAKNVYSNSYTVLNNELVIDSSDNLYLSFALYDFPSSMYKGSYLYKFTSSLVKVWNKRLDPTTTGPGSIPSALALDSSNNVYVGGSTLGAYSGFTNAGKTDIFVLKYSPAGARMWTRQFGGNDSDQGFGIAVSDGVYITGSSSSNPNMLGDTNYCNCFGADAFLAQLNPATGAVLGIDQ
jgi:Beta-propeller repeat